MTPQRRTATLARQIKSAGVDALLITNPLNVTYLTGFTGDSSFVVVAPKSTVLVSDSRFEIQIADECPGLEVEIRTHARNTWQAAADVLVRMKLAKVGVEAKHLTVAELQYLSGLVKATELVPVAGKVEELRAVKDAGEIAAIRHAIEAGERAFAMMRVMARPEDSERETAHALEFFLHRAGADERAFPLIVGVGERSALPHAIPQAEILLSDDVFYLVDWGAKVGGYHGDTTRVLRTPGVWTKAQRGKVESRLAKLYTTVLSAQQAAATAVRPGVHVKDVDAAARGVIAAAGMGELFDHGLGHGVGLQIHESPSIRGNSEDVLKAGMVVTLEPGVYDPGFGGVRIEDTFLITPAGCERLNALPQEWDHYFP